MINSYRYETPLWGAILICCIYSLLSTLFFISYFNYHDWAGNSPPVVKWVFLALGIVFLLIAIKPKNWQAWLYFSADEKGLHFPSQTPITQHTLWLEVSWSEVGEIKNQVIYAGRKGFSIELKINQQQINSFFNRTNTTNKILGFTNKNNEYFIVAYDNNAFQKATDAINKLNLIKNKSINQSINESMND